jgi:hypothetical protein
MTHIEDYCTQNSVSRDTVERYIRAGEIKAVKISGLTYILHDNIPVIFPVKKLPKEVIADKRKEFDSLILSAQKSIKANPENSTEIRTLLVQKITQQITYYSSQGINISGYNAKSIYRKLKLESLNRKTRADRFGIKHPILQKAEVRAKIYDTAKCIYITNATSNFSLLTDLILERAKRDENLYEIAAIPRSTLYGFFKSDFEVSGYKTLHKYINHFNLFKKTLPKVTGAFTDDIGFFDYILGDDGKRDVSSVLVWDETARKWVHKQVKIWFWIEAKTMFPLGWEIKVGDFTVNDLKESLTRLFLQWGLPNNAVVVDNGIGRSADFKTFLMRAGLGTEQLQFSTAYDPTNKAPIERSFGLIKNEFDVFFNNFVGPNKEREARHFTEKLSPEETLETLNSYKSKLENFLTGFFIERIRTRRENGKTRKITIKDFFDAHWQNWNKIECDKRSLRYAFGKERDVKYNGEITILGEKYQTFSPMPLGWYGRKFRIVYNTADMSEVDMYAIDDMVDSEGKIRQKGTLLQTLYCVRTHPQKNELIRGLKKNIIKSAKKLADNVIALKQNNLLETEKFMPYAVANNGELIDELKLVKRQVVAAMETAADKIEINTVGVTPSTPTETHLQPEINEDTEYSLTSNDDDE